MIVCFAILALLLNAKTSSAQLLLEENFDYPLDSLNATNGWTALAIGSGTNPIYVNDSNITYSSYPSIIGKAVRMVKSGQDIYKPITATTTGSVYASFIARFNDMGVAIAGDYFFDFMESSTSSTNYKTRVFVTKNASNKVAFGLSKSGNGSAAQTAWTTFTYDLNTNYLIVVKYTFNTATNLDDVSSMWINPIISSVEPTADLTNTYTVGTNPDLLNVGRIGLRQGSSTNGSILNIDGIRVANTWADVMGFTPSILTPPSLTAAVGASVKFPFDVTFTENAAWRDSIYEITYDGNVLPTAAYNKTVSGKITFDPAQSAFLQTAKTANIVVKAKGYSNATVSQTLVAGNADATYCTATISTPLALNSTSTVTVTAKDLYGNPVSGFVFKYGVVVVNNNTTTNESYTVNGVSYTSTTNNVALTATNASGIATYDIVIPATVDGGDSVKVRTYMNDGSSTVGNQFIYAAPTTPTLNINGAMSEATLTSDTLFVTLSNETFVDNNITNITLNNVPTGVTLKNVYYVDNKNAKITFNYDNTDFDSNKLFTITIAGNELNGNNPLNSGEANIIAYNEDITVNKDSILTLNAVFGAASNAQIFVVTGTSLVGNYVVTAPSNFEVSNTSATLGYSNSVFYTPNAGSVNDTIWVRMNASAPIGTNSGNVVLTSLKAINDSVFVKGTSAEAGNVIISQVYEGTSSNRFIEVTNIGSSSVDLANPQMTLKLFSNKTEIGANAPTSTFNLTGTLLPGQSLLIKGTSVAAPTYALTYSPSLATATVTNFNGSGTSGVGTDIVALYQSTDLKDVFAGGNMTYVDSSAVRKNNVNAANSTYIGSEWFMKPIATIDTAVVNTNDRLGYHRVSTPDELALEAEVLKYMNIAFVANTFIANDGIDSIVVKLKAGQTADGSITIARQPADGIYLKTAVNAYLLKAQRVTPFDTIENATLTFTKGIYTKDLTVAVTIQSTITDFTAPSFVATYPKAQNISESGFDLAVQTDEPSNTYYVVVANDATAPSVSEVIAGQQSGGSAALYAGNINVINANTTYTAAIVGTTANTQYDVYFVAKDKSNPSNTQANVTKLDVATSAAPTTDLFFSEYIEGVSNNKAIEIYNPTSNPVNLSNYTVKLGANGGVWGNTFVMTGTLAPGAVYVIANSGSAAEIIAAADTTSTVTYFNGDDALGLFKNGNLIDVVGKYLNDPGTAWDVAGVTGATLNHTIVRKWNVRIGDTSWTASAGTTFENSQWYVYEQDDFTYIGSHDTIEPNFGPVISNIVLDPSAPTSDNNVHISATIVDSDTVAFAMVFWGLNADSLGYNDTNIIMFNSTGNTYQTMTAIPAQAAGTTVYYVLAALDNLDGFSQSDVFSYSVALGVYNNEKLEATIYPNPAKDNVNINFGKITQGELTMYNANGQLVFTKKLNDSFVTIPLNDLSQGMYMLQIKDNNGAVITRKISVQ